MDQERLVGRLAERFALPEAARRPVGVLLRLLCTDPRAPTAIRAPDRVLGDHLADSLVALELDAVRGATAIADLGAGAGLPGLVLAAALPAADVALVESAERKCRFIAAAIEACSLPNASVVCRRAEEWHEGLGRCDLVTARALAPLPVVAEYAAPLLCLEGSLVVWRGRRDPREERAAALAAARLGLEMEEPRRVTPYARAQHRHLQRFVKVALTPAGFPRRAGMARKRPLGSLQGERDDPGEQDDATPGEPASDRRRR